MGVTEGAGAGGAAGVVRVSESDVMQAIASPEPFPLDTICGPQMARGTAAYDFFSRLLDKSASSRATLEEVWDHPFLTGGFTESGRGGGRRCCCCCGRRGWGWNAAHIYRCCNKRRRGSIRCRLRP